MIGLDLLGAGEGEMVKKGAAYVQPAVDALVDAFDPEGGGKYPVREQYLSFGRRARRAGLRAVASSDGFTVTGGHEDIKSFLVEEGAEDHVDLIRRG